jgi:hypothetical protein
VNKPVHHDNPTHVVHHDRPSHLDNPVVQRHIKDAHGHQADVRRDHPDAYRRVEGRARDFNTHHQADFKRRGDSYRGYYRNDAYRSYYSPWYRHGFYGGFFYPVVPCVDIGSYFYYPEVDWMYNTAPDADYAKDWYGQDTYPVDAFPYAGVLYPTDTLRDLGIDVSGLSGLQQYNYRQALTRFMDSLVAQINDNLTDAIQLGANEVVVDHYQNLNNLIVIEGFVDHDDLHYAFKATLDLSVPAQTLVFVPTNQQPDAQDLANLQVMNDRIVAAGGNPLQADEEPTNP